MPSACRLDSPKGSRAITATDRRPLAFLVVALAALSAAAWTPLQEFRAGAVASGFAASLAAGDSVALARMVPAALVADALCAYRSSDVRRWPWRGGSVARRAADLDGAVAYVVSVSDGHSLRVAVTPGWRPHVLGFTLLPGTTAGDDVRKWRVASCAT